MAVNVFLTFYTTQITINIRKLEKWYFLICYGIPAIPALAFLILDLSGSQYYGDATVSFLYGIDTANELAMVLD
jgi:hypothetical protein